jgi:6-pyruvoyltetrahydropterin/6-carboxytetrahydropterin synthase
VYKISKDFMFSASHFLTGLPEGHQCARLHGHNYIVRVKLAGDLQDPGFVRDYGDLSEFKEYLDVHFEHRHLGAGSLIIRDHVGPEAEIDPVVQFNPTAERLAFFFFHVLRINLHFPEVYAVGVSETPKTFAWYEQDILLGEPR